jgi:hypothetical protein
MAVATRLVATACVVVAFAVGAASAGAAARPEPGSFLGGLSRVSTVVSTVPANGDLNPYGIAVVPTSTGALHAGNVLVSNFNAKSNNQGTGTTIVEIAPSGKKTVFATVSASRLPGACPGGVGLDTALAILPGGYVVVGSLPTTNGQSGTAKPGCLIVLNRSGTPVETIAGAKIEGPWDMAAVTHGSETTLFVSMVLNGGAAKGVRTIDNSTVVRIRLRSGVGHAPSVLGEQVVGTGFPWRDDKTALVIGPTGVALGANGTLYVADTLGNRIAAIPGAMTRTTPIRGAAITVSRGGRLIQPLGLTLAPNGDIVTTNAGNGNMVETTPAGKQVFLKGADSKSGAGSLFGLTIAPGGKGIYFVDDGTNTLRLLH